MKRVKMWQVISVFVLICLLMMPLGELVEARSSFENTRGQSSSNRQKVLIGVSEDIDAFGIAEATQAGSNASAKRFKNVSVVAAELTEREIERLRADGRIKYIEKDAEIEAFGEQIPWGVGLAKAPAIWPDSKGKGIKVAIIDTGVDIRHEDLLFRGGYNAIDGGSYSGSANHGTLVSGVIGALANGLGVVGMAPSIELYAVKALDDNGRGSLSALINGLDWAIENNMHIINMSLGTNTDSKALRDAVDRAYEAGILLVAAAGNSGTAEGNTDTIRYPAKYNSVVAVGAVDKNKVRASFSATGPELEISAPGVSILSTVPNDRYGASSGTSMAAPHVTGAAALIWSMNSEMSNADVRQVLHENVKGKDNSYEYGSGILDLSALEEANNPSEPLQDQEEMELMRIVLEIGSKRVLVDGEERYIDVSPYLDSKTNRTMVPIRFISETMGADVEWYLEDRTVTIELGETNIKLFLDSKTVSINGVMKEIDAASVVRDNRTFVPVRFVSETLGADVEWIYSARQVTIEKESK